MPRLKFDWPQGEDYNTAEKVSALIPKSTFNYFFHKERSVFTSTPNARARLLQLFFTALHKECLAQGVPDSFDIENEARVAEIMSRLNFNAPKPTVKPKPRKTKTSNV